MHCKQVIVILIAEKVNDVVWFSEVRIYCGDVLEPFQQNICNNLTTKWHTRLDTIYFAEAKFLHPQEILTECLWGYGFTVSHSLKQELQQKEQQWRRRCEELQVQVQQLHEDREELQSRLRGSHAQEGMSQDCKVKCKICYGSKLLLKSLPKDFCSFQKQPFAVLFYISFIVLTWQWIKQANQPEGHLVISFSYSRPRMQMYVTVSVENASPPIAVQIQSSGLTVICTEAESSQTGRNVYCAVIFEAAEVIGRGGHRRWLCKHKDDSLKKNTEKVKIYRAGLI